VTEDCLRDAARELAESPEVDIIQHESEVMEVVFHYIESGIPYPTRCVKKFDLDGLRRRRGRRARRPQ
jgi:hypothetical protein